MRTFLLPLVAAFVIACGPSYESDNDSAVDTDSEVDTDTDTDADTDSDTDADSDTDTDSDTDADADTDTDTDVTDPDDVDDDGDGFTENDGDCNDANATVNPTGTESYNDLDDDCDGVVDNGYLVVGVYSPADTVVALDYEAVYTLADLGTIDGEDWEDAGGDATVDSGGWAWWVIDTSELLAAFRLDVDMAGGNNPCEGYGDTARLRTDVAVKFSGVSYTAVPYSFTWSDDGVVYTGCSAVAYF